MAAGERLLHLRQTILRSLAVWRPGLHAQTKAREPTHLPLIRPFVYIKTIMHNVEQDLHTPAMHLLEGATCHRRAGAAQGGG